MKRVQPDVFNTLRNEYIGNLQTSRKLKRLWGTEVVNGVEVFTRRQFYHTENLRSNNFEKLFKFLGAYKDVTTADYKGVRDAWMYFNKNKPTDLTVGYDDFVSENLNKMWWDDADGPLPENLTLTASLVIDISNSFRHITNKQRLSELINLSMTKEQIKQSILDNYEELWDITTIRQEGIGIISKGSITNTVNNTNIPDEDDLTPDDPWLQTVVRYALKDIGIPCTIKEVEIGTLSLRKVKGFYPKIDSTIVIDIEIPYKEFISSSAFVNQISNDLSINYTNLNNNSAITKDTIQKMSIEDMFDDTDVISRTYTTWESVSSAKNSVFNSFWLLDNGKWYLKTDPFLNPKNYGLKRKQTNEYLLSSIDTSYRKKKIKWYKKAAAVILVVVAFIFALPSGGGSLTLLTVASAILVASLVLTLAILVFAVLGMHDWASAFAVVSQWIEPLVLVATVITLTAAIKQAVTKLGKQLTEKSTEQLVKEIFENVVLDNADALIQGAKDFIAGNVTNASIQFATKLVDFLTMPMKLKTESINDKNKDLQAQYEQLIAEQSRENDVLQGFAKVYAKPATADWSMYAAIFDSPYERGGGLLAMGNIQKTTVQALRKAVYDSPVFDNMLIKI